MITPSTPRRGLIARRLVFVALTLAVVFGAGQLDSITTTGHAADAHHTVVVSRETKANPVAATSTRSRGGVWFASLVAAAAFAAIAARLLGADRRAGSRRRLEQFSIRLRAPPSLHVAHL